MDEQDRNKFEPLLTVQEVARRLALSPRTIRDKVLDGRIPFVKVDRSVRFRWSDIEEWIEANTREAA